MVLGNRSYGFDCDFPPIDGPRAPLADVLEFEDYCIDGSCYVLADNNQRKNTSSDRGELNINAEPEAEADEEDETMGNLDDDINDPDMEDTVDEEDDEEDDEDEEIIEIDDDEEEEEDIDYDESYPELSKGRKGSEPVAEDSYDFSVMDTDKESGRKRKTPGKGVADKKKKSKK